jgi:hypothetical protein
VRVHLPLIFLNIVEVVPANNDGSVHLGTVACSSNNSASDRNCSSEWALLVNVGACIKQKFNNPGKRLQEIVCTTYYPNMWLMIWQTLTSPSVAMFIMNLAFTK